MLLLLFPPEPDGDGVQVVKGAGFDGCAVARGVFVVARHPIGPRLARAGHLAHAEDLGALGLRDVGAPPADVVHVVELLGRPRLKQARGQVVMTVAHHAGDGKKQLAARLDERQQMFSQIRGVASEVVVRVDANDEVEEPLREGKRGRIRLERNRLPVGEAAFLEEAHVVGRIAPEVGGVHGKAALSRHEGAREPCATAEVEDDGACGDACHLEKLFTELERVWPHAASVHDGLGEGVRLRIVHDLVLFCENPVRVKGFGTQQAMGGIRAQSKT